MLAITPGEPAGIGPDICLSLVNTELAKHCVIIACPELMAARAAQLGISVQWQQWRGQPLSTALAADTLLIKPISCDAPVQAGTLNPRNAPYVLDTLNYAIAGCQRNEFSALVTGPVNKGIINAAGIAFTGHTEYLAAATHTNKVVMMLSTPSLRVALVTTHLPLRAVPAAITADAVAQTVRIVHRDLRQKFGIAKPALLLCGLNPHAGEDGHMGREEIDIINPVAAQLRAEGINVSDAIPADTAFTPAALEAKDAVIAMYHDQGLPVLKAQGFGAAVNITLGLPINRTSVDHGTALSLAGSGTANNGSLISAINCALALH